MNPLFSLRSGVVLVCLGLVLPGVGRADQVEQTPAEDVQEVPGTQQDAPRQLLPDEQAQPASWRSRPGTPRGLRILGEVGGGLVAGGALGLAGGLVSRFFCEMVTPSQGGLFSSLRCLGPALFGLGTGVVLGASLGVWQVGEWLEGNGSLLSTLGGGLLGVAGGALMTGVVSNAPGSTVRSVLLVTGLPVLSLAGCILGYELSQKVPRRWAARGGLLPLVSFMPNATVIGLGGHF